MTDTQMNNATDTAPSTASGSSSADTTPVAKLAMVTLDAPNAALLGDFYSAVLGWPVAYSDENYAMLTGPSHALGIGTIADYKRPDWPDYGHKQFHLDLAAESIEAAAARCVELGAERADPQPGETWVVLLDPAGHPFCISDATNWD
ncbi:MAG: VOC family protein [Brevibacterium sp.]|nr:VOC family protein [Brevibacterium sp.]